MAPSESSGFRAVLASRRVLIAGAAAVVLAAGGTATALATAHSTASNHTVHDTKLAASTPACTGPTGAASSMPAWTGRQATHKIRAWSR